MSKFRLVEKLRFWWATRNLVEGQNYRLDIDELGVLISIITGKFGGIQFRFANMQFIEDAGTENNLAFNTVVVTNLYGVDATDPAFTQLSSDILRIMLNQTLKDSGLYPEEYDYNDEKYKPIDSDIKHYDNLPTDETNQEWMKQYNENGNADTIESVDERSFYEESPAVSPKRVSKRKLGKKAIRTGKGLHSEVQQAAKPKRTRARTSGKKRPLGE